MLVCAVSNRITITAGDDVSPWRRAGGSGRVDPLETYGCLRWHRPVCGFGIVASCVENADTLVV
eukprot:9542023-Prorocentrum_lima.AAC.1